MEKQIFSVAECDDIARKYYERGKIFHALAFFNEARNFSVFNKSYYEEKGDICRKKLNM